VYIPCIKEIPMMMMMMIIIIIVAVVERVEFYQRVKIKGCKIHDECSDMYW
jgi:hypothetical protein